MKNPVWKPLWRQMTSERPRGYIEDNTSSELLGCHSHQSKPKGYPKHKSPEGRPNAANTMLDPPEDMLRDDVTRRHTT